MVFTPLKLSIYKVGAFLDEVIFERVVRECKIYYVFISFTSTRSIPIVVDCSVVSALVLT